MYHKLLGAASSNYCHYISYKKEIVFRKRVTYFFVLYFVEPHTIPCNTLRIVCGNLHLGHKSLLKALYTDIFFARNSTQVLSLSELQQLQYRARKLPAIPPRYRLGFGPVCNLMRLFFKKSDKHPRCKRALIKHFWLWLCGYACIYLIELWMEVLVFWLCLCELCCHIA